MTAEVATGDDASILTAVLHARAAGSACVVVPDHLHARLDARILGVQGPRLVAYSSGSTSPGRAIVRQHDSWSRSHDPLAGLMGMSARDRVWIAGPLTSTLFLYGAVHARELGASVLLAHEGPARATAAHCVPRQALALLQDPPADLRVIITAGERVPSALHERAADLGVRIVDYYGAAELSFVAVRTGPSGYGAFPGAHVEVRDHSIWVRSPYVSEGYVDPSTEGPLQADGEWASVGDRGRWTGAGLAVEGRMDTAVSIGGHTVVVEDVEEHLASALGAVTAVVDVQRGDTTVLVAVTEVVVPAGARRAAVAGLPYAARPRRWVQVERLPLTASGKVDRMALARIAHAP